MTSQQLTLDLKLADSKSFDTFEIGRNQWVKALMHASWINIYLVYIYGQQGVGKTHLLRAIKIVLQEKYSVIVTPLQGVTQENLNFILEHDFILLDEVNHFTEELLFFDFLNRVIDTKKHLIIASRFTPQRLTDLSDLQSRLSSELVLELLPLGEEDRLNCLKKWMQSKNLLLEERVINFILNHCERNTGNLFQIIDLLDERSQQYGTRLTIPFIKSIIFSSVD